MCCLYSFGVEWRTTNAYIMKKIFFRGKVYDHNKDNPLIDIQKEIQAERSQGANWTVCVLAGGAD